MAKEGYPFVIGCLIPTLFFGILLFWFPTSFMIGLTVFFILLTLFMVYFFRDPERVIPTDPDAVVSPADGKITRIAQVEPNNPHSPTLVSIFLSPIDVHINRAPVHGTVKEVTHTKGRFRNAMSDTASLVNEQKTIILENERVTIVLKQIAGFLARRCVFWKQPGESVALGERVGLIKFSSRTDIILPPQVRVLVKTGERVVGGTTIIGRIQP